MKPLASVVKLFCFCFILFFNQAKANYHEMFGGSFSTSALSNLSNFDENDPANNIYFPAMLAYGSKNVFLFQYSKAVPSLFSFKNIVIKNATNNSSGATEIGDINANIPRSSGTDFHISIPIYTSGFLSRWRFGFSMHLPAKNMMNSNSGDPFLPEYVFYKAQNDRLLLNSNLIYKLNEDWSFSVGAKIGFSAQSVVDTNLSLNGGPTNSFGSTKTQVSESMALQGSLLYKRILAISYEDELNSEITATVAGEINSPSLSILQSEMKTLLFYDPKVARVATAINFFDKLNLILAEEYSWWSHYRPPTLRIAKLGGVIVPSADAEKYQIKNTLNHHLGVKLDLSNQTLMAGVAYAPTPLISDLKGPGNSIGLDRIVYALGYTQHFHILDQVPIDLGLSLQYHSLIEKRVVKIDSNELGGPSYLAGGHLWHMAVGGKIQF